MLSSHLIAGLLSPLTSVLYAFLPGGSLIAFLGGLPGGLVGALFNLPGAPIVLGLLNNLGLLG